MYIFLLIIFDCLTATIINIMTANKRDLLDKTIYPLMYTDNE